MTTHNPEHAIILNGKVAILNREGILGIGQSSDTINSDTLSRFVRFIYKDYLYRRSRANGECSSVKHSNYIKCSIYFLTSVLTGLLFS